MRSKSDELANIVEEIYDEIQEGKHNHDLGNEIGAALAELGDVIIRHIACESCHTPLILDCELKPFRKLIENFAEEEAQKRYEQYRAEARRDYLYEKEHAYT